MRIDWWKTGGRLGAVVFSIIVWLAVAAVIARADARHEGHRHTGCLDHQRGYSPREVKCITRFVFGMKAPVGLSVEACESGFDARSWNPSGAAGPWQVIWRFHPDAPNPYLVGAITRWVWRVTHHATDWSPWVCKPGFAP